MDSEQIKLLDALIESARLLGVTQAKKGFGCYTQDDSRFEAAMYQDIASKRRALEQREAVPEPEPKLPVFLQAGACKDEAWVATKGAVILLDSDWRKRCASIATPPRDVPEGFVLVPMVPTEAMLAATKGRCYPEDAEEIYTAMLAAAPKDSAPVPTAQPWHEGARLELTVLDGAPQFVVTGWLFDGKGITPKQGDLVEAVIRWGLANWDQEPVNIAAAPSGEGKNG